MTKRIQDGSLARSANPEMAIVEEEIDPVFFELDGEGCGFGNFLQNLNLGNPDFVAAGSAFFGANISCDNDAGFLR